MRIELDASAKKDLAALDKPVARRIVDFLQSRVAMLEDPRSIGQALKGSRLGELWKYRLGDYRILCEVQDEKLVVLVLRISHRREIYR